MVSPLFSIHAPAGAGVSFAYGNKIRMNKFVLITLSAACLAISGYGGELQDYLDRGQAQEASKLWKARLSQQPADDNLRFETAVTEVIAGTQELAQKWHRFGLQSGFEGMVPFLRMPIPRNPQPEAVTYEQVRRALLDFQTSLNQAASDLAPIQDSSTMKVPLDVQSIKLELAPGAGTNEAVRITLWSVFYHMGRGPQPQLSNGLVHFDVGDARWLEGYCHLLSALIDMQAAYDGRDLFNHTAQLFFPNPVTPYPYLKVRSAPDLSYDNIMDAVTLIHLLHLKLEDPQRMRSARENLLSVIQLSRRSWRDIDAETDNDHKWIPNPRQDGALTRNKITPEMLQGWNRFLDESESLLQGKTLAPFWRLAPGESGEGINLEKVFTQPADFDLVLWLQGTAADPYLEKGSVSDTRFWSSLNQAFHGDFLYYAIWFN